jgi:hypothetical protein
VDQFAVGVIKSSSSDKLHPASGNSSLGIANRLLQLKSIWTVGFNDTGIVSGLGRLLPSDENQDNFAEQDRHFYPKYNTNGRVY